MSQPDEAITDQATGGVRNYSRRVYWLALIYFLLNIVSVAIMVIVAWRIKYFITLSQRSNIETLTLAIIFILALYYVVSTFRGFLGAVRIFFRNLPGLISHTDEAKKSAESRKQAALKKGDKPMYVCLDNAVQVEGKPQESVKWQVVDEAGKLGDLVLDGVKLTFYPTKGGMDASIFSFVAHELQLVVKRKDPDANLLITQWSTIDEDEASGYYSMVTAFGNLEKQLGEKGPLWPRYEIAQEDVDHIQQELTRLTPTLRDEVLLPDLEFGVEYSVPVMPEPLGFIKLTRSENRADPIVSMGCASLIMVGIMAVLTFFILLPPWLPSK